MACTSQYYLLVLLLGLIMMLQETHEQGIDKLIAGANENPGAFDLLFDISGNSFLQELDMLLTKEQYDALQLLGEKEDSNSPNLHRKKRKAIKALSYRWKNKIIPYKIARGVFNSRDLNQIKEAIAEWSDNTCLRFKEATSQNNNRIYLDNGAGCYSYVGMISGSQKIGLAPGCRVKGVITHEIGHAVGFHHEQNRPDRDDHVRIMRSNIPSNLYYNFKKYPWSAVTTYNVPYDYGSVMHYGGTAFSSNGQYTIRTINPSDQNKIGNRKGLSFFDVKLANIMYKCNEHCTNNLKCPGHGFVGKDCTCWCPGNPVRKCAETAGTTSAPPSTQTPVTTPRPQCQDQNKYCSAWAKAGYCGRNSYVTTYCKESCNSCSGSGDGKRACKDLREHCDTWNKMGYCKGQFSVFMSENCAKTCKTCKPNTDPGSENQMGGGGAAITLGCQLVAMATTLVIALTGRVLS